MTFASFLVYNLILNGELEGLLVIVLLFGLGFLLLAGYGTARAVGSAVCDTSINWVFGISYNAKRALLVGGGWTAIYLLGVVIRKDPLSADPWLHICFCGYMLLSSVIYVLAPDVLIRIIGGHRGNRFAVVLGTLIVNCGIFAGFILWEVYWNVWEKALTHR